MAAKLVAVRVVARLPRVEHPRSQIRLQQPGDQPQPAAFDLSVTANHPEFTDLMKIADMPAGAKGGPLAVSLKAAGTTQKASVSQLDAKWGDSSLTGTASYEAPAGATPNITANLTGGTVNLTPFMAPGTKTKDGKPASGTDAAKSVLCGR